ncbi:MAG TPA: dihydropteroate synthase [Oceanospirillales bacterium]|nr:dihydropteroate synthase [Oleispira sp.]HCM04747.1 dihydropteroate synthase [Oceanospirillales bacterium]|tara:strand:- start:25 stop:876 length:852 start_codon:yes stop_codon:yes gene_type:complete
MKDKLLACGARNGQIQQLDLSCCNIMGILNVTPDSFSDGGSFNSLDRALFHAERMINQGATLIDVGGESTRPGAAKVSLQEELDRVIPVVEAIHKNLDTIISVDTSTPQVITQSAAVGAGLINDVRALQREGALDAAASTNLPICLMHMQGQPDTMQKAPSYDDVVSDIHAFLAERIHACAAVGINKERLILDPGFGFGKALEHNYQLLNQLETFHKLGLPLLVGVSRKTMIGKVLNDRPADQRLMGSVAAAVIAAMKGASILRVHDVAETCDAIKIVEATLV